MPYSKINPDEMILRDHLAFDRTVLANERTLLAYARTAIALYIAGGTLLKLLRAEVAMLLLGSMLIVLGTVLLGFGAWRYSEVRRHIGRAYDQPVDSKV